ncbi:MAG: glycosyltransferase family 39 protein [bacterium]|jgi:4-amino-4-deoxy-L-arabinose transferase-like glycosyltransferase|nr:glycosyltransferase family 39 protein [bacterium]
MQNHWFKTTVLFIFVLAAVLRLATVGYGTNVDEGVYWVEGKQMVDGYLIYQDTQVNKPPLVALVSAFFFLFGETPIYPMRLGMVAFSLLGLYWLFQLTRLLLGRNAALAALIFIALEPYSCVWAKFLHTSTWAPFFEAGVFLYWIRGLRRRNRALLVLSGLLLGIYALNKQSAIFVLLPGLAAWFLFAHCRSWREFLWDMLAWAAGFFLVFGPLFLFLFWKGIWGDFWFDIWTAHHLLAPWFKDHTLAFRWHEMQVVMQVAPVLWIFPVGSLLLLRSPRWRAVCFGWIWLGGVFWGNTLFISHLWKHYLLVPMFPCALLAGGFWGWLGRVLVQAARRTRPQPLANAWILFGTFILFCAMVLGWYKNDWTYPGLTLTQERQLARYIQRACPGEYLLNLTNPAFYVWTDKKIPPAVRGDHITRIPYFMTFAGRGYMTMEDLQHTVEGWQDLSIDCVVAYDKYLVQMQNDPVLAPLKAWLLANYQPPRRIAVGESYYGWFWLFEKKKAN